MKMIDFDLCAFYLIPTVRLTELHRILPSGTSCQTVQPKNSQNPVDCRLNQPRLCDNWLNCESVLNHLLHSCSLVDPTLLHPLLLRFPLLVLLHLALFQKLAEATPLSNTIPKVDEGKGNNAHGQT
jgi:hypothetical protein